MPSLISYNQEPQVSHAVAEDYSRIYKQSWKVKTSSDAGPAYVRANFGTALAATYTNDSGSDTDAAATLNQLDVELLEQVDGGSHLLYRVTGSYGPWDPLIHASSPLNVAALVEWEGINYEQVIDRASDGSTPLVNSAGDYFDPGVTIDEARCVLKVTKNLASVTPATLMAFSNKINTDVWNGFPVKTLKFAPPRIQRLYHQNVGTNAGSYWRVEHTFEYNRYTWDRFILDQGYRQVVGGVRRNILVDGAPAQSPVPLNGSGVALAVPVTAVNVLQFQVYPDITFATAFSYLGASLFF